MAYVYEIYSDDNAPIGEFPIKDLRKRSEELYDLIRENKGRINLYLLLISIIFMSKLKEYYYSHGHKKYFIIILILSSIIPAQPSRHSRPRVLKAGRE